MATVVHRESVEHKLRKTGEEQFASLCTSAVPLFQRLDILGCGTRVILRDASMLLGLE
jgi:hypothetical protein